MNDVIATLIAMSGDEQVLVVRRPFVEFTGSLEAGMLLGQLLYWTGKGRSVEDGFVAKSDKDWALELYLTRHALRQARMRLEEMGILETKVRRWQGSPTVHYRIIQQALSQQWIIWIQTNESLDSDEPLSESRRTGPEITSEITSKDPPASAGAQPSPEAVPKHKARAKGNNTPKAIEAFREATHRFPTRSWWPEIEKVVAAEVELWRDTAYQYVGAGWSPVNVKNMLAIFKECREKGLKPADVIGNGRRPRESPMDRSMRAIEEHERRKNAANGAIEVTGRRVP